MGLLGSFGSGDGDWKSSVGFELVGFELVGFELVGFKLVTYSLYGESNVVHV